MEQTEAVQQNTKVRTGGRDKGQPVEEPEVTSILLANICSLENKLQLGLATKQEVRDCCVLFLMETWWNLSFPNAAISLEVQTMFRLHRNCQPKGKSCCGGVCIYLNTNWTNDAIVHSHCSPDIEFLTVKYRPFYLPWEFNTVSITAVHPPPVLTLKNLWVFCHSISDLKSTHPEEIFIAAGDLNQANMKTALAHFHQFVDFPTRGKNTLDLAYSNIEKAFRTVSRPHTGSSHHLSVKLITSYKPLLVREKPSVKQVKVWSDGAMQALQDCFYCTDWDVFRTTVTRASLCMNMVCLWQDIYRSAWRMSVSSGTSVPRPTTNPEWLEKCMCI